MTSLTPRYSAEGLDKFHYSSEGLGIDPGKLKTAKVAGFTLLREAQREVKIYCHGGYQYHDARKQFTNSKLEIRNSKQFQNREITNSKMNPFGFLSR